MQKKYILFAFYKANNNRKKFFIPSPPRKKKKQILTRSCNFIWWHIALQFSLFDLDVQSAGLLLNIRRDHWSPDY